MFCSQYNNFLKLLFWYFVQISGISLLRDYHYYCYHSDFIQNLQEQLNMLNENYNCKKEELNEAKILIENLQEELVVLKNELDMVKCKPLQDGSQGNSLFAEVDDK